MEEQITISKAEYDDLVKRDIWLTYLESAGVDNWQGMDYAREMWRDDGHNEDEEEE